MRARKKKHSAERISACSDFLCENPELNKGKWKEFFTQRLDRNVNESLLEVEIGCGKGSFIVETAKRNPDKIYIAIERIRDVILLALEKAKNAEVRNVIFLNINAEKIKDYFEPGEISRIYLNFSDPWRKSRHAKRRLTSGSFLNDYRDLLTENGAIFFKTDNRPLFDYSLETIAEAGWRLENVTFDLHNSEWAAENIMTEYEKNFSDQGFPINRLEAWK